MYNPKQIKEHEEAKVDSDSADHLFILVHGLGGSSADMKQLMNEIALISPNS